MPLHQLVEDGDLERVMKVLGEDPSKIHERSRDRDQPLHIACWQKHLQLIGALLAYRPNVNARGYLGRTPLHYAVHEGDVLSAPIVLLLMQNGADPGLEDDNGFSVEDWAKVELGEELPAVLQAIRRGIP